MERLVADGTWQSDLELYDYFDGHQDGAAEINQQQAEEIAEARHSVLALDRGF